MSGIIENIMRLELKLLESDITIAKNILDILSKQINKQLSKNFPKIQDSIKKVVIDSIKNQPEYASLIGGQLQYEFGITNPKSRLDAILNTLEQSMVSSLNKVVPSGYGLKGGFKIEFIKSDYSDILPLPESSFVSEKGSNLQWLNWLLIQGDSSIVFGYSFVLGGFKFSRTGGGVMRGSESGSWQVPSQFSGTAQNNWITRGILSCSDDIQQLLNSLIENLAS
jgi:hypothetical protein